MGVIMGAIMGAIILELYFKALPFKVRLLLLRFSRI